MEISPASPLVNNSPDLNTLGYKKRTIIKISFEKNGYYGYLTTDTTSWALIRTGKLKGKWLPPNSFVPHSGEAVVYQEYFTQGSPTIDPDVLAWNNQCEKEIEKIEQIKKPTTTKSDEFII